MYKIFKQFQDFIVSIENGDKLKKTFNDFEKFYGQLRENGIISSNTTPPPKRKFLQGEAKLVDRRRTWIENFVQELLDKHSQK